ncbi:HFL204Cp [Eremothecium sinecaudum]|uniref:HFL204Cp n=1 Tax=Eremothecium sinecaudum TaxID=45286 RepID=A0A0X8HUA4_9SACH|nr:HFL204Cp [Eremothecium sinecaudum]AMD21652.1 HFL204Cp [Eremothecium sinecaudum]
MDSFRESEEEDNNPFAGTNHLYASGIAAVAEGDDDFVSCVTKPSKREAIHEARERLMSRIFGGNHINSSRSRSVSKGGAGISEDEEEENGEDGTDTVILDHSMRGTVPIPRDRLRSSQLGNMASTQYALPLLHHFEYDQEGGDPRIQIIDAGQYKDTYGNYAIGYTISFNGRQVTRRYSEFDTLRLALTKLLPTIIIPPIPSKHPLIWYFLNPLNAENDIRIIDKRRRLLSRFLNNCYNIETIREHPVFLKFLSPDYVWREVLLSPPISILPENNLLAPPLMPTKPSPLHLLLPNPTGRSVAPVASTPTDAEASQLEAKFADWEVMLNKYQRCLQPLLACTKQQMSHFKQLASALAELGAYYNAFSLEDTVINLPQHAKQVEELSRAIEKIGQAVDVNYVSSELFVENVMMLLEEPISELMQFIQEGKRILKFRKAKQQQFLIIGATLNKRKDRIEELKNYQSQMARLEEALKQNAKDSPTVAKAVKKLDERRNRPQSTDAQRVASDTSSERQWIGLFRSRRSSHHTCESPSSGPRTGDIDAHLLTDEERGQEISKIENELEKLNECYKLIQRDMDQVNESMLQSFEWFTVYLQQKWVILLREFSRTLLTWLKDCLIVWKNARAVIDSIEV